MCSATVHKVQDMLLSPFVWRYSWLYLLRSFWPLIQWFQDWHWSGEFESCTDGHWSPVKREIMATASELISSYSINTKQNRVLSIEFEIFWLWLELLCFTRSFDRWQWCFDYNRFITDRGDILNACPDDVASSGNEMVVIWTPSSCNQNLMKVKS